MAAVMKPDAAELARIGEYERAFALEQNQMIVLGRPIVCRFDVNLAGHAEMNEKEVVAGKFEEHPLPARVRADEFCSD